MFNFLDFTTGLNMLPGAYEQPQYEKKASPKPKAKTKKHIKVKKMKGACKKTLVKKLVPEPPTQINPMRIRRPLRPGKLLKSRPPASEHELQLTKLNSNSTNSMKLNKNKKSVKKTAWASSESLQKALKTFIKRRALFLSSLKDLRLQLSEVSQAPASPKPKSYAKASYAKTSRVKTNKRRRRPKSSDSSRCSSSCEKETPRAIKQYTPQRSNVNLMLKKKKESPAEFLQLMRAAHDKTKTFSNARISVWNTLASF